MDEDIAEQLGALNFLKEEDGSSQIYAIMNPKKASGQAVDSEKYARGFWMEKFTGKPLAKKEKLRQNWNSLLSKLLVLSRWTKIVVRMHLEDAALRVRPLQRFIPWDVVRRLLSGPCSHMLLYS